MLVHSQLKGAQIPRLPRVKRPDVRAILASGVAACARRLSPREQNQGRSRGALDGARDVMAMTFSSLAVAASAWLSNSVVPPLRLRLASPPIIAAFPVGSSSPSASSSPLGTSSRVEAKVDVRDAGPKGLGAFATEPVSKGTWVCA